MPPAALHSRTRKPTVGVAAAPSQEDIAAGRGDSSHDRRIEDRRPDPPVVADDDRPRLALTCVRGRKLDHDHRVESSPTTPRRPDMLAIRVWLKA